MPQTESGQGKVLSECCPPVTGAVPAPLVPTCPHRLLSRDGLSSRHRKCPAAGARVVSVMSEGGLYQREGWLRSCAFSADSSITRRRGEMEGGEEGVREGGQEGARQ